MINIGFNSHGFGQGSPQSIITSWQIVIEVFKPSDVAFATEYGQTNSVCSISREMHGKD